MCQLPANSETVCRVVIFDGSTDMTEAPATGYVDWPEEILPAPRQSDEYSAQRWESEGGLVHKLD